MKLINFLRWKIQNILTAWRSQSDPGGHRFIGGNCYLCGRRTTQDPKRCKFSKMDDYDKLKKAATEYAKKALRISENKDPSLIKVEKIVNEIIYKFDYLLSDEVQEE